MQRQCNVPDMPYQGTQDKHEEHAAEVVCISEAESEGPGLCVYPATIEARSGGRSISTSEQESTRKHNRQSHFAQKEYD